MDVIFTRRQTRLLSVGRGGKERGAEHKLRTMSKYNPYLQALTNLKLH